MPGKPISVKEFMGLDLRRVQSNADPKTQRVDVNVSVTPGRGLKTRPGTYIGARAHASTRGLFAVNGLLTTVAPSGYPAIALTQSPLLRYMFIGNGTGIDVDHIVSLSGAETYGQTDTGQGLPYVNILTKDGNYEHHYGDVEPSTPGEIINTLVDLPFKPSGGLIKLASRLFTLSNLAGTAQFNSILGGARDWTSPGDSGFLPVSRNAPGDRTLQGLGYIRDRMVVAFADSMQMWAVDENPDNMTLVETLNGPGTKYERALANVLGDAFYFSRGGFRSLITSTIEGQREENDIGINIKPLSETLPVDPEPIALWSQARGQYLCAFGSTILVYTYIPSREIFGWTQWDMPFSVTDMVEVEGTLYARDADHNIQVFDDDLETDNNVPFDWRIQTQFLGNDEKARLWSFIDASFSMSGKAKVYAYPDYNTPDDRMFLGEITDSSTPFERTYLSITAPSVALAFEGNTKFQLDAFAIRVNQLAV